MPYKEFWFAPITTAPDGDGSSINPFHCGSQLAFDARMQILANTFGDDVVVHLYPGAYQTFGWHDSYAAGVGWNARKGWRILGAGIANTELRMNAGGGPEAAVIGSAKARANDFVEVLDLTIDCNVAPRAASNPVAYGVLLVGNHCKIQRVKVVNWGSLVAGKKSRPLAIVMPSPAADILNPIIRECMVTSPATGVTHRDGTLAIFAGRHPSDTSTGDVFVRNASIHSNCVHDINSSNYSKDIQAYCLANAKGGQIVGNTAYDVEGPVIFGEAGGADQVLIQSNSFIKVLQGVVYRFPTSGSSQWTSIVAQNNYVALMNKSAAKGISISGSSGSTAKKVVVEGNVIRMFETSIFPNILGIEFNNAENVAVKSNIVDVPVLPNAIVFGNTTTVAQCINNRTATGQVIQAFAALLATQINANKNLWIDLGKAMAYRLVSTLSSVPAELTLPVIDSPAINDPSKAPPGYRFTIQNASVVNGMRLKNANGVVIAALPAGVVLTLTASNVGWEIKYSLERDAYEQLTVSATDDAYLGMSGGEAVDVSVTVGSRSLFLPQAFDGWSVLLNNTGSQPITIKDFNGGTLMSLANGRAIVAVAGTSGWITKLFAAA